MRFTYSVQNDYYRRLKHGTHKACAFWNHFIDPKEMVYINVSSGYIEDSLFAKVRTTKDENYNRVVGSITFNKNVLYREDNPYVYTSIFIHELGHVLGINAKNKDWTDLFFYTSGRFKKKTIAMIPQLEEMVVERMRGKHSRYCHWDEKIHQNEIMTSQKNSFEYIHPMTIEVMRLFNHRIKNRLYQKENIISLINKVT